MNDLRAILVTVAMLLAACGQSANRSNQGAPAIASRPDVTVTFDGKRRKCVVALSTEAQGSAISCDEVVEFIRDQLRLPGGSIYDIRRAPDVKAPDVDQAEIARVSASLSSAGYRFIGQLEQP